MNYFVFLKEEQERKELNMYEREINQNCSYVKLIKMLDLLAYPRGFEPLTLGLEMRGIHITLNIEYHTNSPKR